MSQSDVAAVRHALQDPRRARALARASSTSTTCSRATSRKRVMLLVEEMPAEERIRKGNVIYRTRTRDVEDTVAQLLHDEDQSIASAAVLLVEERGPVVARRRSRARARASRRARSARVRSGVVGAGRQPRQGRAAQAALAGAAAGGRARRSPAPGAAVRLHARRRAVPAGAARPPGALRDRAARSTSAASGDARSSSCSTAASPSRGRRDDEVAAPAALGFEELLEGSPMRVDDHRPPSDRSRCR